MYVHVIMYTKKKPNSNNDTNVYCTIYFFCIPECFLQGTFSLGENAPQKLGRFSPRNIFSSTQFYHLFGQVQYNHQIQLCSLNYLHSFIYLPKVGILIYFYTILLFMLNRLKVTRNCQILFVPQGLVQKKKTLLKKWVLGRKNNKGGCHFGCRLTLSATFSLKMLNQTYAPIIFLSK